jgi:hypothetical protein
MIASLFFLAFGFTIPSFIFYILATRTSIGWLPFAMYIFVFLSAIISSAIFSKNLSFSKKPHEFQALNNWISYFFLVSSCLAFTFTFIVLYQKNALGILQFSLVYAVSTLTLIISIIEISVASQRYSVRRNLGLTQEALNKQMKIWKESLVDFPNHQELISSVDDCRYVITLFDRGSFNLAVLWLCNTMEQTIDAATKGIISENIQRRDVFRKEGKPKAYSTQLETFGFKINKSNEISIGTLWHEIRVNVAHHNFSPDFKQTCGAINILLAFVTEMPGILQAWR